MKNPGAKNKKLKSNKKKTKKMFRNVAGIIMSYIDKITTVFAKEEIRKYG